MHKKLVHYMQTYIWPVFAGFITASVIMLGFEFVNHFLYPLPLDLDTTDTAAVHAFTASLPWTVYILVFMGWAAGSAAGGYVAAWLASAHTKRHVAALTALLVTAGAADMFAIGFPLVAIVLGLGILLLCPYACVHFFTCAHK